MRCTRLSSLANVAVVAVVALGCSSSPSSRQNEGLQGTNSANPNGPNGGSQPGDPSDDDPSNQEGGQHGNGSDAGGPRHDCVFNEGGTTRALASGWSSVADMSTAGAPAGAVLVSHGVWTGHEVIGWGANNHVEGMDGAFSYNPATDTWKRLPDAGLPHTGAIPGYLDVITMVGPNRVAFWGGRAYDPDGAVFDLCKGTWTKIPRAPIVGRNGPAFAYVASTDELVIWGGVRSSTGAGFPEENKGPNGAQTDGAAYNFHTGTWRMISSPTWKADEPHWTLGFMTTTTDDAMILYGGGPSHGGGPTVGEAFRYEAKTDAWTELATPSIQGRMFSGERSVKVGGQALFFGGHAIHMPNSTPGDGAFLDLASLSWTTVPAPTADVMPAPQRSDQAVWMLDGRIYTWGGYMAFTDDPTAGASGGIYDKSTGAWTSMPSGGPTGNVQHATLVDGAALVIGEKQMMMFKP